MKSYFNLNFHTEPDINRLVLFWVSRNYSYIITKFKVKDKNKIYFIQHCSIKSVTIELSYQGQMGPKGIEPISFSLIKALELRIFQMVLFN